MKYLVEGQFAMAIETDDVKLAAQFTDKVATLVRSTLGNEALVSAALSLAPDAVIAPKDGDERVEPWGSGYPGNPHKKMTLRYSAKVDEWLVVGEAREDLEMVNNTMVRYDQKTDQPESGNVPICDLFGGHVGWVSWEKWSSWPIAHAEEEEAKPS